MPIYTFRCEKCLQVFDKLLTLNEDKKGECPKCGHITDHMIITGTGGFRISGPGVYKPTSKLD